MTAMITDPADLMSPHDPARLEEALAADQRLHVSTDRAAAFQAMLPWSKVGDLVTLDRVLSGHTRVMINGRNLPIEMFTQLDIGQKRREFSPRQFQQLCGQGLSLVINGIEQAVPAIAATTAMIQRHLAVTSGVNAYVSFSRSSAFRPHWDAHHVLLLQLYGRKRWSCFGRRETVPTDGFEFEKAEEVGEPEWEAVLQPGDILFLPRGEIHAGQVTDSQSLHLTISIRPPSGMEFLHWLHGRAKEIPGLHQQMKSQHGEDASARRFVDWQTSLHELIDGAGREEFLTDAKSWPTPYQPINAGLDDPVLPHVWIKPSLRRWVALPVEHGGLFEMGKMSVELSAPECVVLDKLLERHAVRYGDLASLVPDLSPDAVADAVTKLSRKSLIFLLD